MLLVPVAMAAYVIEMRIVAPPAIAVLVIACAHALVSATYHFRCALKLDKERIGNAWHRLDQTMNHVVCLVISVVLSHSAHWRTYPAGCAVFNLFFAARLWRPAPNSSTGLKVHVPLAIASLLYLIPICWIEGWLWFAIALCNWLLIGIAFIASPVLGGLTHAASHLLFVPLAIIVEGAASKVNQHAGNRATEPR